MEHVINMTRQTISSKSIYQFVLHTSEVCASHDRLRRGGSLLPFQKHTPPMLRVWAEGISGTNTIYPWVTLLKSFPEHPKNAAWLQEDRIFLTKQRVQQRPGWQLDVDQGRFLYYLCMYTYILRCASSSRGDMLSQFWTRCSSAIWQDIVLPRDFSSNQLTALSFVFQQSCKLSAKAEAPHLLGVWNAWTGTTPSHSKCSTDKTKQSMKKVNYFNPYSRNWNLKPEE